MHLEIGPCVFEQDCESDEPSEWVMLFWPNTIQPLTMASHIIKLLEGFVGLGKG